MEGGADQLSVGRRTVSAEKSPRIAHKCTQIPGPAKTRRRQITENLRVIGRGGQIRTGDPLRPRQSRNSYVVVFSVRSLAKFAEKADHSALSAHKLHTSSARGLGRRCPRVLGHSSIRTTQDIYARISHGQDDEAAKKWDEFQQRNQPAASTAPPKGQVQ